MAAAAMLDFRNREFLFAHVISRTQTHHCTKFSQNRSFRYGYIAIFRIIKMAAAAVWILENVKFYSLFGSRVARRVSMPNFIKIGQSFAKILRFFDFSRWRPLPYCIFEIVNFYLLSVSTVPRRITVPNFVKIACSIAEILHFFSNFQDGRRRHLGFLKSRNFIGYCGPEFGDASARQISSKSVNWLRRY